MKNYKRTVSLLLTIISLFCIFNIAPLTVDAAESSSTVTIEMLENGYYYETIIDESIATPIFRATTQTITRTKTTNLKNSSGTTLWSVSIKATFSFDGTTATCTSCTPSAKSYNSAWTIQSIKSSKSGNSATATVVARYTGPFGITEDYTKKVTITCNANGEVS